MQKLPLKDQKSTAPIAEKIKMVVKADGTEEPFSVEKLHSHLSKLLEDLNKEYINLDIIIGKVTAGLPSGKFLSANFTKVLSLSRSWTCVPRLALTWPSSTPTILFSLTE